MQFIYICNCRANLKYTEKIVCYIGIADFGVFSIKMRNCQMLNKDAELSNAYEPYT